MDEEFNGLEYGSREWDKLNRAFLDQYPDEFSVKRVSDRLFGGLCVSEFLKEDTYFDTIEEVIDHIWTNKVPSTNMLPECYRVFKNH